MNNWQLKTPVCFIIFNRPDTTEKVFQAIRQAKPSQLFVVADGARNNKIGEAEKCLATRAIIDQVDWECEVLTNYSEVNLGCRKRVSSGLDWVFSQVEEAIILEDDCLPDPSFFRFCEELLEKYRYEPKIMLISGQNIQFGQKRRDYSYYFSRYNHCWGWASWKRAWQYYDNEMKLWTKVRDENWLFDILQDPQAFRYWEATFQAMYEGYDTWDYPWLFACYINQGLSILPNINLVSNIGFGKEGTHATDSNSILANIPVEEMQFPLKHPPFIIRDTQADNFTEKTFYSGTVSTQKQNFTTDEFLINALYLLKQSNSTNKIELKNITLVTISSIHIEVTLLSLVISNLNVNFNRILFFTSEEVEQRYLTLFPQLEIIKIKPIKSLIEYSRFVLKELYQYIETDYCLITQNDGFIINPEKWDQDFLNYDYIGAPWLKNTPLLSDQNVVKMLDFSKNRVGNGGFSLRSKKLLELASQLDFDNIKTLSKSEDLIICYYYYDWFKEQDIKFAPLDVAIKFSFEQPIEEYQNITWKDTFGFHGKNHLMSIFATLSERFPQLLNSEQPILETFIHTLNLKEINIIIFPDWSSNEDELGLELIEIISNLANHPDHEKMTLLIDISNIDEDDANLFLQSIAMNLMMELELDITEYLTISLVNNLTTQEWALLLSQLNFYLHLEQENKEMIKAVNIEKIPLLKDVFHKKPPY